MHKINISFDSSNQQYRINFACRVMLAGRTQTRAFDNCFEMWDGHEVAAKIYRRALKNPKLMAAMPKYLDIELCRRDYEAFIAKKIIQH